VGPGSVADPTNGLENAYWKLACHLALLAPETHVVRQRFADLLQREFPALLPKVVVSSMPDAARDLATVQSYLRSAGIKLWPDLSHQNDLDDLQSSARVITQAAHLVVVLSPQARANNGIIRRELRFARQQGKTRVVVALSGTRPACTWLDPSEVYLSLTPELLERLRTSPRGLRAPVLVPAVAPGYVERREVQQQLKIDLLEAAMATSRTVVAVWGQAGSGKTAVVSRLCQDEDIVDTFQGGIFFVNAGETAPGKRILSAISPEATIPEDPAAAMSLAGSLLQGQRFLLIIDDVWGEKEIATLMSVTEPCAVIVLTRDLKVAATLTEKVVTLSMLTPEEAATFLPGGTETAERLGRLPLALSLARAALQQEGTFSRSAPEALQSLAQRVERHGIAAFDRPEGDRNLSIARSIEYTLTRLQNWERKRFEQLVKLVDQGKTTLDSVQQLWVNLQPGIGEPRPLTRRLMEALCQKLSELSLIEWEPNTQSISLPYLIREYYVAQGIFGQAKSAGAKVRMSSGKNRENNKDVDQARRILGGLDVPFADLTDLIKRLKNARYFADARQLLSRLRRLPEAAPKRLYWAQQHALCMYKDQDLPYLDRSDRALEILGEVENLNETKDQETLGLAGAIFKYKWVGDGQRANLERSLAYYLRGYAQGVEKDIGYTGINAAFVLDLIAFQEESESRKSGLEAAAGQRRLKARAIRLDITEHVPGLARLPGNEALEKQWWFLVTIAEAFFGLGRYDEARYWLRDYLAVEVDDWAFESTARQLARLALLQNGGQMPPEDSPAFHTLRIFLGNDANALRSVAVGKVGLALSGGGFRASLFHIGVLAKLAELDALRHVEVLSCVSGGSIIGAHYYLELRRLLEAKPDEVITQKDFIELVKRIETDFLAGIQANLRMRLAANPFFNLMTFFRPHYTLTDRLGELFEKKLYSKVSGRGPLFLDKLLIHPVGACADFAPKLDNWHRAAKVPVLILNATTLNTGHNWQFTASWMGEPASGVMKEVDGNDLLRRMYYWEAPKKHRTVRLGRAVAASACVPGLFAPVEFAELYPKRTTRLVDGGVHDNQGVGGLLEQECSVLLVSDASGQMSSQNHPGAEPYQVPLRASSILGARVREAEYLDLEARQRSSQIKSLMFLHLKKDLDPDPVNWVDCTDALDVTDDARPKERRGPLTGYGMLKTVQARIAAVRTDLDSFTDAEAFALMLSGYRMTEHEFAAHVKDVPVLNTQAGDWRFLSVEKAMNRAKDFEDAHDDMMNILKAAGFRAFKMWRLSPVLLLSGIPLVAAIVAWLLEISMLLRRSTVVEGKVSLICAFFLAVPAVAWILFRIAGFKKPFLQLVSGLFLGVVGWVVARLHLWIFDPVFLAWGSVKGKQYSGPEGKAAYWIPLLVFLALAIPLALSPVTRAYWAENRGDYATAISQWNQVAAVANVPEPHFGRERAFQKSGLANEAIANYVQAISLMPNPPVEYPGDLYVSLKSGDYNSAVAICNRLNDSGMSANVKAACDAARSLQLGAISLAIQGPAAPALAPPIIPNARVFLASGKRDSTKTLADLKEMFRSAQFQISGTQVRDDPGRPDTPEVRYFNSADKAQAESIALFMKGMLKTGVPVTYMSAQRPGYFEIWLGR
jgi:predicted acylesterase/phospholipase RssA